MGQVLGWRPWGGGMKLAVFAFVMMILSGSWVLADIDALLRAVFVCQTFGWFIAFIAFIDTRTDR